MSTLLVLIGGHEDRSLYSEIHRELVRLAGGDHARIIVCTAGTRQTVEYGDEFVRLLRNLGAEVTQLDIPDRATADLPATVNAISTATGVFFTGGDQRRIMSVLGGSRAALALRQRAAEGMLVAGTSAGAAIAGDLMIAGTATPAVEAGMGLLPGVIVDQHFSQRVRLPRLCDAVAQHPEHAGIGIDEDTAVVVQGRLIRVIGTGRVTVVAPGGVNVMVLAPGESLIMPERAAQEGLG